MREKERQEEGPTDVSVDLISYQSFVFENVKDYSTIFEHRFDETCPQSFHADILFVDRRIDSVDLLIEVGRADAEVDS